MGPGAGFRGYDHSIGVNDFVQESTSPVLVSMFLSALLDEEQAYLDYKEKTVKFPRLGKTVKFEKPGDTVSFSSTEFGFTCLKVPQRRTTGTL